MTNHLCKTGQGAGRTPPIDWVQGFYNLIPRNNQPVLDLACGDGRHALALSNLGYGVLGVDRDLTAVRSHNRLHAISPMTATAKTTFEAPVRQWIEADLENKDPFAKGGCLHRRRFAGIIVVNYLHRPLFPGLLKALCPAGVLIYETFARGNDVFGRPRNPAHLLKSGELLELTRPIMRVIAYEYARNRGEKPAIKQRICAIKA